MRIYSYKNYSFIDKENHIFEKVESGFKKIQMTSIGIMT